MAVLWLLSVTLLCSLFAITVCRKTYNTTTVSKNKRHFEKLFAAPFATNDLSVQCLPFLRLIQWWQFALHSSVRFLLPFSLYENQLPPKISNSMKFYSPTPKPTCQTQQQIWLKHLKKKNMVLKYLSDS